MCILCIWQFNVQNLQVVRDTSICTIHSITYAKYCGKPRCFSNGRQALEPKKTPEQCTQPPFFGRCRAHPGVVVWVCNSMYICNRVCACLCYLTTWCKALCRMAIRLKPFFWHSQSRWAQAFQDPWPYVGCWVGRSDDTDDASNFSKPLTLKDLQSWTKPRMPWAQRNNSKTSRGVSLCWKVSVRHGGWRCWSVVFSVIHTSWLVSSLKGKLHNMVLAMTLWHWHIDTVFDSRSVFG